MYRSFRSRQAGLGVSSVSVLRDLQLVGDDLWNRFGGGKDGTLWYYRSLATAYGARDSGWLGREIDRIVSKLELLAAAGPDPNESEQGSPIEPKTRT